MAKNIPLSSVVVLVLVALGIGFLLGILIMKGPHCALCPVCYLDSKVAAGWMGYATGELKEISGRDFTLASGDETLKLVILDGASIQVMDNGKLTQAKFEDVKVGDKLQIQFVFSNKKISGSVVTILPK